MIVKHDLCQHQQADHQQHRGGHQQQHVKAKRAMYAGMDQPAHSCGVTSVRACAKPCSGYHPASLEAARAKHHPPVLRLGNSVAQTGPVGVVTHVVQRSIEDLQQI